MDPDPTPADELVALCDQLCDGTLAPAGRARLEALVLGDAPLRRLYVEHMHLHAQLRQDSAHLSDAPLQEVLRAVMPAPVRAPRRPQAARGWSAAAAALVLVAVAYGLFAGRADDLAVLQETRHARWGDSTLPTASGSLLAQGSLRLLEGLARLRFHHGAEVIIAGPADLELIDRQHCRLRSGSLVAHVPEAAKGFTVLTDEATLIDHGTDFGISIGADGGASVHVLQGEVELRHRLGGPALRLLTQQMATITPDGLQPAIAAVGEPGDQRPAAPASPFTHELTTASGEGAAVYVASPGTDRHFSDSLLMLKNARTANFLRKAVLRFDLAAIPRPQDLQAAELTLHFAATGYGFAAFGGDARFAVYAVTDEAQDAWSPATLAWATVPAFDADPGRVDTSRAVLVGGFTMPRGVLSGPMSITGPALLERVRHDANRLLTLVVVRENPLDQPSGVVHGFAGNHHPSLPPPTLRLR